KPDGGGEILCYLLRWTVRLCVTLVSLACVVTLYIHSDVVYFIKGAPIRDVSLTSPAQSIYKENSDPQAKDKDMMNNSPELDSIRNSLPAHINNKTLWESGRDPSHIQLQGKKKRLPQAIIFGVKKCGTHALTDMISLHPQVVHAKRYEMHFFEKNTITGRDKKYQMGLEWYREKMPPSYENQITMEKTPAYFISHDAPERIFEMNSSIKLILIVRDPTTRVVSDYLHTKDMHEKMNLKPFEEEILQPNGEVDKWNFVVKPSLYAEHMARWFQVFRHDQILIVDGDKLVSDPLTQITRIEKFLNIEHYVKQENLYWNPEKGFYCMRSQKREWCLSKTKGRPHPEMNPEAMSKLRKFFAPLNDKFYKMVGHNFSWPIA
ncbi:unnamed protein product, partial [Meganyctiphanes norvegica]